MARAARRREQRGPLPVEFPIDGRGGQALGRSRDHPVPGGRTGEDRADGFAAAGAERRAAEHEERHVRSDLGGQIRELVPAHAGAPEGVAGDERGGRVGAAAGQAAGDRDLLAQVQPGQGRHAGRLGQDMRRPDHQVRVVERQLAGALAFHRQRQLVAPPRADLVVERDGVIDGGQLVIAVMAGSGRRRDAG